MRPLVLAPVCFVSLLVPAVVLAGSGERGFEGVVHTLENRYHVRATRIPFLGLISIISRRATHGGVGNLHLAEFDNFDQDLDGEELNQLVETRLGEGWERVIRETSRNGTAQTLIFMRPDGDRMGLFVLDADGHELNVVQCSVDPAHLSESVAHYDHHGHDDSGSNGSD